MQPQSDSISAVQHSCDSSAQDNHVDWFEYPVRVHPNHTDYAGVVWHGSYIAWMEEARIEYFRALGVDYVDIVATGCELPVVELSIRYHRALRFGTSAMVKTRLSRLEGVRIVWDYQICSTDAHDLHVTAQVTLVAIDRSRGKIMRQLPELLKNVITR